jgi:hypothetical protein
MRVVMTLLVRDEVDVVRQHLLFHLNAGVDFVIVTDNGSVDGTSEVLAELERAGVVRVLNEPVGAFRQREWQTRMARLAATEHGADWVINSDADELWWPRGGDLREVLAAVPARYGIVGSLVRHFVPVPDDGRPFAERMTLRLTAQAPVNDPASPWRPYRKIVHRADPDALVIEGGHDLRETALAPLRGWYPVECLHFPLRSPAQVERKGAAWGAAVEKFYEGSGRARAPGAAYHALQHRAAERGEIAAYYDALALTPDDVRVGLERGLLAEDTRVRDALRALERDGGRPGRDRSPLSFPTPTTLETVQFAVDAAVLGEADVIRTQRWLDDLERRTAALERLAPVRLERVARRSLRRRLRRPPA